MTAAARPGSRWPAPGLVTLHLWRVPTFWRAVLFARFVVIGATGTVDGRGPLA